MIKVGFFGFVCFGFGFVVVCFFDGFWSVLFVIVIGGVGFGG